MCECSLSETLVGDGCSKCNPEHYLELFSEELNELKEKVFAMSMFVSVSDLNEAKIENRERIIELQDAIIECQARLLSKRQPS